MFKRLRGIFSHDLFMDLGTVNTRVYRRGAGIALDQPSLVAGQQVLDDKQLSTIVAVGVQAKRILDDASSDLVAVHPIRNGVIADLTATKKMLREFIREVHGNKFLAPSPRVLAAVPSGSTPLERRAIRESVSYAGARQIYLIEAPMVAAIGAGIPVDEARGSMVLDMGGGVTEVAVICLNSVVYSSSVRMGSERFNEAIVGHARRNLGILMDESNVEIIKQEIGCASHSRKGRQIQVEGRSVDGGAPRCVTLTSDEVLRAFRTALSEIVNLVEAALESVPPELASDVAARGVVLTGGGALLRDFDRLLMDKTGLGVFVAEDPLTCAVRGGGRVLELIDKVGATAFGIEKKIAKE